MSSHDVVQPPPPVVSEEEHLAACGAALVSPYQEATARVQAVLAEIREAQATSSGALETSRGALALSEAAEELQHAVGFIPVYAGRAQAAAKEMRALRARLDACQERAQVLKECAANGTPFLPRDYAAYTEAALELVSGLKGMVTFGQSSRPAE